DYYDSNKETLGKLIKGWADANDYIIGNSAAAMQALQKNHYRHTPMTDIDEAFKAQKMFTSQEWKKLYADGTVTKWLQQVTDFFVRFANISNPTPASEHLDPRLYLETIKA